MSQSTPPIEVADPKELAGGRSPSIRCFIHTCLCREAGLTCIEVSGYGRSAGYSQGQTCLQQKSNHMWNAVELEGQWFLLDVCWGAGLVDVEKRQFIPR